MSEILSPYEAACLVQRGQSRLDAITRAHGAAHQVRRTLDDLASLHHTASITAHRDIGEAADCRYIERAVRDVRAWLMNIVEDCAWVDSYPKTEVDQEVTP